MYYVTITKADCIRPSWCTPRVFHKVLFDAVRVIIHKSSSQRLRVDVSQSMFNADDITLEESGQIRYGINNNHLLQKTMQLFGVQLQNGTALNTAEVTASAIEKFMEQNK